MKKLRYINKMISMLVVIILASSCDLIGPVDEIKPTYKLTEESTFTDGAKTEAVLNGVYCSWREFYVGVFTGTTMMMSGNYEPDGSSDYFNNMVQADDEYLEEIYVAYYGLIQKANYLIKAMQSDMEIPGLTAERRTEIEAEARLQRAMVHFFLLRNFGQFYDLNSTFGIVVEKKPVEGTDDVPRSSVQETYDFIMSDLDYAMDNAPAIPKPGRLTNATAKAMKAKVALYTGDWSTAANLALETINESPYHLETDFRNLYAKGYKSNEVIFSPIATFHDGIRNPGSYLYSPGELLMEVADTTADGSADIITGDGYDPRFAYAHASNNLTNPEIANNKYPFAVVSGEQSGSHFVLRMGEMYLIYAEAKVRASASGIDADALIKLNAIRARAGVPAINPATKAEMLEAIRIEKQLELFGEFNEPWFDMVRYHILGDLNISDIKSSINNNNQLILPYPVNALSGNGGLVQNPK